MNDALDNDGYPTEETLKTIREWDSKDPHGLMEFMRDAWAYSDYFTSEEVMDHKPVVDYHISTAGWSGNEDMIGALLENDFMRMLYYYSWQRGGHYVFRVPRDQRP